MGSGTRHHLELPPSMSTAYLSKKLEAYARSKRPRDADRLAAEARTRGVFLPFVFLTEELLVPPSVVAVSASPRDCPRGKRPPLRSSASASSARVSRRDAAKLRLRLLRPLAEGALIFQLSIIQRGDDQGPWHSILAAFLRFPYLLGTYFLMALAVSVGWMLLFFPAFWIYARLCFAPFRVMLRGDTPLNALRTSFTRSGPCQWHLLAAILLAGTLVFAVAGFTNSLLVGVLGDRPCRIVGVTRTTSKERGKHVRWERCAVCNPSNAN